MANPHRGEVEIQLGGETLTLVPTFEGIIEAEGKVGGLSSIIVKFARQEAGLKEIAALVYGGLVGSGEVAKRKLTFSQVGEMCRKEGVSRLLGPVLQFANKCFAGDPAEEPEADPKKA
jgi:hypothetical protein